MYCEVSEYGGRDQGRCRASWWRPANEHARCLPKYDPDAFDERHIRLIVETARATDPRVVFLIVDAMTSPFATGCRAFAVHRRFCLRAVLQYGPLPDIE